MAPLIEHNTSRVRTTYRAFGLIHKATIRYGAGTTGSTAQASNAAFWNAIMAAWVESNVAEDFTFLAVDFSPAGDPAFYPAATLPVAPNGEKTVASATNLDKARHTKFVGRAGGRNVSLEIFGVYWPTALVTDPASKGYVTAAEDGEVGVAVATLAGSGIRTISDTVAVWKAEASVKVNDYWFNELKG